VLAGRTDRNLHSRHQRASRHLNAPRTKVYRALLDPEAVAGWKVKAIRARRPKTPYVADKYARPLPFMRWFVGGRAFDGSVTSQAKRTN
jgi:hypothetical protein